MNGNKIAKMILFYIFPQFIHFNVLPTAGKVLRLKCSLLFISHIISQVPINIYI